MYSYLTNMNCAVSAMWAQWAVCFKFNKRVAKLMWRCAAKWTKSDRTRTTNVMLLRLFWKPHSIVSVIHSSSGAISVAVVAVAVGLPVGLVLVSVLIVLIVLIASMFLIQKKRKKGNICILVSYGGQEVHCCMLFNTAAVAFLTLPCCAFWVAEFAAMREQPKYC